MKYIYPTLLQTGNIINSHNCFNLITRINDNYNKVKKKTFNCSYISTIKIKLNLNNNQKIIINNWLNNCIDIYNLANNYIKNNYTIENKNKIINFFNLRKILNPNIKQICLINGLNKHTGDYAIKHCIEMYKSAFSNHTFFDKFNITNLDKNKRRKNLIIEPNSVSKKINSIFVKILGKINSNLQLNIIKKNSILQYDSYKKSYIIIVPFDNTEEKTVTQNKKCGIDIGVRTFLTTYSKHECMEIGTNNNKIIDKIHKKLDHICSSYDKKLISKTKKTNLYIKNQDKLKNKITDVHNKTARLLLSKYRNIVIGKVSTKKMISNLTGNLHAITKRRLMALSHYKFRMKLKSMATKFNCNIIEHDEFMTSKTCSNCKHINRNLGSSKIYNCYNCNLNIDRDINASINIYKNKKLPAN
jgi:transposase